MKQVQQHWENIFSHKSDEQKSWYQSYPSTSVKLIEELNLSRAAAIIDVGGGDSKLVDVLLEKRYTNLSVLDISETAILNVKKRLGNEATKVKWIISDILEYKPERQFELWHDRAAFHFLTTDEQIRKYVHLTEANILTGGYLILGTFSEKGPLKCSGLDVMRYSRQSMAPRFADQFENIKCIEESHETPSKTIQHFLFCVFRKTKS